MGHPEYPFDVNRDVQEFLEHLCSSLVNSAFVETGDHTLRAKDESDEEIEADRYADEFLRKNIERRDTHAHYLSEEDDNGYFDASRTVYISDPIDGSSEFNRAGPYRSPLTTAVMAMKDKKILGACVGDIWRKCVYGVDHGLYLFDGNEKKYMSVSEAKRTATNIKIAAYAPSKERIVLIRPLFDVFPYVHNNGGHPFALQVVEGQSDDTYAAALEAKPARLWEQIGPLMASRGKAYVSRLDGEPLELNPYIRQTSVTAASSEIAEMIIGTLSRQYNVFGISHMSGR